MQITSTMALCGTITRLQGTSYYKKTTSHSVLVNLAKTYKHFPGLKNKIQGLSRTAKKSRTFQGCGNPAFCLTLGSNLTTKSTFAVHMIYSVEITARKIMKKNF